MSRHQLSGALERDCVQADVLDDGPDNRDATRLRRTHINLIGALPYIAEETFNGVGGLNVPMHRLRKRDVSSDIEADENILFTGERHRTSRGALRPQPGCVLLVDSACHTWL
jgi:hypothetical protein